MRLIKLRYLPLEIGAWEFREKIMVDFIGALQMDVFFLNSKLLKQFRFVFAFKCFL